MAYIAPKQYWPQRVRSVTPHTLGLNFECDGIILADLGGRNGNFRVSKNQNSRKCHELSRKSIKKICYPSHPGGSGEGGWGSKFQKSGKFHELSRKSIKICFFTHPTPGGSGGGLGVKFQKSGKYHELSRKSIKPPQRGSLWEL